MAEILNLINEFYMYSWASGPIETIQSLMSSFFEAPGLNASGQPISNAELYGSKEVTKLMFHVKHITVFMVDLKEKFELLKKRA